MAVGSIGSNSMLLQNYISSGLSLDKYVSSLMEQNKTNFSIGSSSSSYFNDSLAQKLGAISSNAVNLQTQIGRMAALTQYSSDAVKSASYSNEGVLSASVAKNSAVASTTTTKVDVTQLASGQQNKSASLNANENSFGGQSQFSIDITDSAGKTSAFSVEITDLDDNKTVMQAMAKKINASGISITATLNEDTENGTVNLLLSGTKTGETNGRFVVTDDSVANLGNVDQASQDAIYSVNGKEFSGQSNNDVRILEGVTATLHKTGSTEISYKTDYGTAVGAVQNFLDTFNKLMDDASGTPLKKQLTDAMANSVRGLGYSGIGVDTGGKLRIDDTGKLTESITNGSFARNFQGMGSFGNKLYDVTLNARNTVYQSALKENYNDLLSDLMNNLNTSIQSAFGGGQNGSSFFTGLIFSVWA